MRAQQKPCNFDEIETTSLMLLRFGLTFVRADILGTDVFTMLKGKRAADLATDVSVSYAPFEFRPSLLPYNACGLLSLSSNHDRH